MTLTHDKSPKLRSRFTQLLCGLALLAPASVAAQEKNPPAAAQAAAEPANTPHKTPSDTATQEANAIAAIQEAKTLEQLHARLVTGSPFDSPQHKSQTEFARAGQQLMLRNSTSPAKVVPAGTVVLLLANGLRKPLGGRNAELRAVRESIGDGNRDIPTKTQPTDAEGRVAFRNLPVDSAYRYEVVVKEGDVSYSSGPFRLSRTAGQLVKLYVYPPVSDPKATLVATRALYVIQPRADVFQVQAMFRVHNAGPKVWLAKDFTVPMPEGAKAFQPGATDGDLRLKGNEGGVLLNGTLSPGQHNFQFAFQLPNERSETAELILPGLLHLVDAQVFLEKGPSMTLEVDGFEKAGERKGNDGQPAVLAKQDFLGKGTPAPPFISATIRGIPAAGSGALVASLLALALAVAGAVSAFGRRGSRSKVAESDRERAREILLDELISVERAYANEEIGPRTFKQTRRALVDSLARIEANAA